MTAQQENQTAPQEQKISDKELNFRKQEAMYKRMLEERDMKLKEMELAINQRQQQQQVEEDNDDEPYVDHKKLEKKLNYLEKKFEEKMERKAEEKARFLLEQKEQEQWLKNNSDFYDVMQHADKFAISEPELAESILRMPEGFERQKLVYKNIKSLGLHKEKSKEPSIQEKIDANRKSPYYQPSGIGASPYSNGGDFSTAGQKNAYAKMQELKSRLRI